MKPFFGILCCAACICQWAYAYHLGGWAAVGILFAIRLAIVTTEKAYEVAN